MESGVDGGGTKADLPTNKLRTARRTRKALLQAVSKPQTNFNEMAAKQISTNTSIPEAKLKEIRNVNSENGIWPSGILKSPTSMAEGSLITYEPENNSLTNLKCGSISVIGRRRTMEDTETMVPKIIPGRFAFFGVYDGHGGDSVANSCRDRLHKLFEEELALATTYNSHGEGSVDWTKTMKTCFSKMDSEVIDDKYGIVITTEKMTVGSTATVAVVGMEEMVVANCGDSRAVLSRGGVAVPLSTDHKANRPDEMERVEAAGGRIIEWNGYRVEGVLAISRSIAVSRGEQAGDHYLKPYVISEPTVTVNKRTDSDEFLILATDGLWDVVSNKMACDVVRKCFNGQNKKRFPNYPSATDVADFLAEVAIARGSEDNISIIVVDLKMES